VEENLNQQINKLEKKLHLTISTQKNKEQELKDKLESALNEINNGVRQKREMVDLELKYKMIISDKAKLEEQVANLISSKQLLQQTMAGQLMTIKAQLDEITEEKNVIMEEYRRVVSNNEELQVKYRNEQIKAKTLFDEIRVSKLKS